MFVEWYIVLERQRRSQVKSLTYLLHQISDRLVKLDISCCGIADDDILDLSFYMSLRTKFRKLKVFNLEQNNISIAGAAFLPPLILNLKSLKELNLSNNPLHEEGLENIAMCLKGSNIEILRLRYIDDTRARHYPEFFVPIFFSFTFGYWIKCLPNIWEFKLYASEMIIQTCLKYF